MRRHNFTFKKKPTWYEQAEDDFIANEAREMRAYFAAIDKGYLDHLSDSSVLIGGGLFAQVPDPSKFSNDKLTQANFHEKFIRMAEAWDAPAPKSGWRSTGDDLVDAMALVLMTEPLYSERNYKLPWWIRVLNWCRERLGA
jgi:hypothetical protein